MNKLIVVLAILASCGPKIPPPPVPQLPGDGDANVAKPPPPKAKTNDGWADRTDLIVPPAAKAPSRVELPGIEELKLSNGLQVYLIKSDKLPVVSVQLAVRAGRMQEPHARLGVAEATADMLVKGTKRHDALALAKAIDFVGGTIGAEATFEATLVSCRVLSRNLNTGLELLPEMITQPTFPDAELTKVKDNMLGTVRTRIDDAGALASEHVQNLLWGNDHVRGWINSEASVSAIRRDDVVAWHKAWFAPNNSMLVVAGDIDPKKLKADLERAFSGWKKTAVSPAPTYPEPGLSGIRIRLVDKPGQTQTHIRIAQFGIRHDDPRFFDTLVWNYALGGGVFSSRLMKAVRVEGGKTYGASSSFDRNLDKGSLVFQTFTRNAEALATTKLMLNEIAKMAKDGPTQDEVTAAVANLAGSYAMRFQTATDVGAALIGAELHGFGTEYLTNYPLAVGKVDVPAAKQAAAEILAPHDYVLVMVGDAKDIEPQLKKEGWRYEKVAFTDPVSPEFQQAVAPADAKAMAALHKLIDDAVAAKGGKAKLSAMKALKLSATGTTSIQGQSVPVTIERVLVVPDKMRIDATLAGQVKVTIAVDGRTGWQLAPDQKDPTKSELRDVSGDEIAQVDFERWRDPEFLLLKAADPGAKLTPLPDETIDGKPNAVFRLGSPYVGLEVQVYIDRQTKLMTRMSFSDKGPKGQAVSETDDFGEYKDDSGVKVAHKRLSTTLGRTTNLEVGKVEIDPKLDAGLFKKPAAP